MSLVFEFPSMFFAVNATFKIVSIIQKFIESTVYAKTVFSKYIQT